MYNKKIVSFVILCAFFAQIVFSNLLITPAYALGTDSAVVDESVEQTTQTVVEPSVESTLIGDVNGDGNRNSIDFAMMRMVLLGLRDGFPISNATWASDADGNGVFNSIDFAYMRMLLLGIIKELPAEKNNVTPTAIITPTPVETTTPTPTPTPTPTLSVIPNIPTVTPTVTGDLDTEKPTVPQDFHYVTKTESLVILAWKASKDNVGVTGYDVFVDDNYYETVTGNGFVIDDLEENTTYGFSVKAKDAAGNYSDSTDYIVVTTMEKAAKSYKFKKVEGGDNYTIGLTEDGTVWSWGNNNFGQLGIGSNKASLSSNVPVKVNNLTDIIDIDVSYGHSLALRKDGTVWAWGTNKSSECGIKIEGVEDYYISTPVKISGLTDVKQMCAVGQVVGQYSLVLKNDGTIWAWGKNSEIPTRLNQFSEVKSISDNNNYVIVVEKNGIIWSSQYGLEFYKQLVLSDIEKVLPEYNENQCFFVIKKDGTLWYKRTNKDIIFVTDLKNVLDIKCNENNNYFLMNEGTVFEWSKNDLAKYAYGDNTSVPVKVSELKNIKSIGSRSYGFFSINEDGTVLSIGGGDGDGMDLNDLQYIPKKTSSIYSPKYNSPHSARSYKYGTYELGSDGVVRLVKKGIYGAFGGDIPDVIKIYACDDYVMVLKGDGTVWGWGKNDYGQLGDGTNINRLEPVKVKDVSGIVDFLSCSDRTLALERDGTVWGWGKNDYGQLADGTNINRLTPVKVNNVDGTELTGIIDIKTNDYNTLALKSDGTVWVWGYNEYTQLANVTNKPILLPKKVDELSEVISISLGTKQMIALKSDGTAWGWNYKNCIAGTKNYIPRNYVGINNVAGIETSQDVVTFICNDLSIWVEGIIIDKPVRVTMENDANLRYITINNSFLESFDEDITEYNVMLPAGTTSAPNVGVNLYHPYATYNIVQPDTVDGIAIIEVTAWDGETKKTYKIKFNQPSYAEYKESYHYGQSGTGASGNYSRTYTDMTAEAPGFELAFSRTYNSKNMKVGGFGRGWTFGFESKIEDTGYIGVKQVTLPDGSVNLFEWDGSDYVAENSRTKLTKDSEDTFLLTTKDQYTYHYDEYGYLEWMKDRNGNIVSIDVDSNGKINSVTDQAGRIYNITYEKNLIRYITDIEGGRKIEYQYKDGALWWVKDACGRSTYYNYSQYTFDEKIGPVSIMDYVRDDNNIIEIIDCYETGENKGKISQIIDRNGNALTYNYYPNEARNTITDSKGKRTSYWYDESYYNVVTVDSEGGFSKTTYSVDENGENKYGEVEAVQDRNGNKTTYERDSEGNITKVTNPDTTVKEYDYDSCNNLIWEKDEEGNFTYYVYEGNLLKQKATRLERLISTDRSSYPGVSDIKPGEYSIVDYDYYNYSSTPDNNSTYKVYCLLQSETQSTGTEEIVTEYKYHPNGNIKSVKNPQTGELTIYSDIDYTPEYGWLFTQKSPAGNITEYHYNDNGQLIETVRKGAEDAAKTSHSVIAYDNCGRKKQEVSANLYDKFIAGGNDPDIGTRYSYNSFGQLESITDAEGNVTKYHSYDIYGNVQVEEKPNGGVYKYEFDSLSRLIKVWFKDTMDTADAKYVLLSEYSYVAAQNPVKIELRHLDNSKIARTTYYSDYAGRTTKVVYPPGADGLSSFTQASYYGNGQLKESTDRNGYTTYYNYGVLDESRSQRYNEKWTPVEINGVEVKYNYTRMYYDNAGRVVEEWTGVGTVEEGGGLVDKDAHPSKYIKKTTRYYKDGKVSFILYNDGRRVDYGYDLDRNLNNEITKKNDAENITVEYINNYLGKPDVKKIHINKGDIYPNTYSDSGDEIIETAYTFDKEGNLKTEETDDVYTEEDKTDTHVITYTYDNLGRSTGTEEYVVTEDGTVKKLTNKVILNWEGKPATTQQLENDIVKRTTTNNYNQRGFLETVTDAMPSPETGVTYYGYDRGGRKIYEVAPKDYVAGKPIAELNKTVYEYDLLDRVTSVSYNGLLGYFDESGNWVEPTSQVNIVQKLYTYDKNGNVLTEVDAEGYITEFAYNPSNKVKAILDPVAGENGFNLENAPKRFNYDALGRAIEEITAREEKSGKDYTTFESVKKYVYDDAGNIKAVKSKKNSGASEKTLEAATYDYLGNVLTKTDGNENTTIYEYNNFGKVRKVITPADDSIKSNTIYYQYDKVGNLKNAVDTKGTATVTTDDVQQLYSYDNRGNALTYTVQKLDGTQKNSTSAAYDIYGNKRFETDGNRNTNSYEYNVLNKLVKSSIDVYDIDGDKTTHTKNYEYDKNGNVLIETDHLNNSVIYNYDSLNRLREKKDPYGKSVEKLNYYNDNAQSEAFDALNNRTLFVYDKNNKLVSTTDAEKHVASNTYDVAGNVKTKEDGRTNTTYYGYDEFGKLIELTTEVGGVLQTTVYTYDLNGNMTSQRDAKLNKTIYEYNAANKMDKRFVEGQTDSENYIYNADGSVYEREDKKGIVTTYTYYPNSKVESQSVGKAGREGYVKIDYIYDGNGNQIKATETVISNGVEATIITEREYDELNRVKLKSEYDLLADVANRVVNKFKYDIAPKAIDLPGITASLEGTSGERSIVSKDGTEMAVTLKVHDKVGRLKYVVADGQTTTYDYYDNGNRKSVLYPGGMKEEYDYYKDNLLKTLRNYKIVSGTETIIDQYDYTYDAAHNQETKVEFVNGVNKGKTTYTYDELNRLATVLEPSDQFTEYKYDAAGNREKEKVSNNEVLKAESTYDYNSMNWLETVTKVEYTEGDEKASIYTYNYDKNGNQKGMLIDGVMTVTYQYDNLNRLTKTTKDGKEYKNSYNAEGLRIGKTDDTGTTVYLYESNKVVMELDADGNMLAKNIYGTNLLKRMIEDGTTLYYMYNGHSDVTALLDTEGNLVGSYYYDAWGNLLESSGEMKDKNSILYAGYQYDSETELYYLNARMYDPKVARFLQEDTYLGDTGDSLSLNLYTYCLNNPLIYWDPTGHWAEGDEKFDKFVQLAIMQQTDQQYAAKDEYDKAKTQKEKDAAQAKMNAAMTLENEIRAQQTSHVKVKGIRSIIFNTYGIDGLNVVKGLTIVDYKKATSALQDKTISKVEWTDMRNVAMMKNFTLFKKGTTPPKEIYSNTYRDTPVEDDYDTLNIGQKAGMLPLLIAAKAYANLLIAGGTFAFQGDAANMMQHYLNGTGKTKEINFARMNREDINAKSNRNTAIEEVKEAASLLAVPGKTTNIVSVFDTKGLSTDMSGPLGKNWGNTIGNYRTWTSATVETSKNSKGSTNYNIDMSYNLRDNYKWYILNDNGEVDNWDMESKLKLLHLAGWAREFKVVGDEQIDINLTK